MERELAPGMMAHLWGYNGQSPGPTIEAVEGDKLRIFVTNKAARTYDRALARHARPEWDGRRRRPHPAAHRAGQDIYEFQLKSSGTFMYHPHSDEMVQMAMGMMGTFVVHPRDPKLRRVDRDFVFLMSSYLIDPGTYLPKVCDMTDFNIRKRPPVHYSPRT